MTRFARRIGGTKKQPLPATSWSGLKTFSEIQQSGRTEQDWKMGEAAAKLRKVKKRGLKLAKKANVVGILKKRTLKKLRKRTGKELKSILDDTTPLLQSHSETASEEELSEKENDQVTVGTSSIHAPKREEPKQKKKKKKEKKAKSVTFANEEIVHLLQDSSELEERPQPRRRKTDSLPTIAGVKGGKKRVKREGMPGRSLEEEVVDERRKKRQGARRLRRQKKKVCFSCRQPGHVVSECTQSSQAASGICFKCGAANHSSSKCRANIPEGEYPYAKCFICGEVGHLSRSCPDNPRGLYPRGGGCKVCGSVEHLKANCPEKQRQTKAKKQEFFTGLVIGNESADAENFEETEPVREHGNRTQVSKHNFKVVRF